MTEFQPIWDATLRSFREYFAENKGKDTMYVPQEVMDNYLKGMQESQRQVSKVAEGKHSVSYTHLTLPTNREV